MTTRELRVNVPMCVFIFASFLALAAPLPTVAQEVHEFNVPASDPASAIRAFGAQAEIQILASADDLKGKQLNAVRGDISIEDGLNGLLAGTGLDHRYVGDRAVALVSNSSTAVPPASSNTPIRMASRGNSSADAPPAQAESTPPSKASPVTQPTLTQPPAASAGKSPDRSSEGGPQLNEIMVTATKRESTLQNTPISITAISGLDIQERGLSSMSELAQSVPGLAMRTSGPGQTEFELRGMASEGGNSPTVGFYLDDTPLTAPAVSTNNKVVIDPNLYDLNRIEVLRGPQGTLYGSGSMGGTIKLISNAPNPTAFDASADAIMGHTDGSDNLNHGENAMVNLPFGGGTAALRIVGSESHTSGWINRIVIANGDFPLETNPNGTINPSGTVRGNVLAAPVAANYRDVNDADLAAVRTSVLWTPTDRLTITPMYFYQQLHQDGPNYIDSNPGTNAHYEPFDSPEPVSDYFNLASLPIKYGFDSFDITSTTSHWSRDLSYTSDASEQWQWVFGLPSYYTSKGGIGVFSPTPMEQDKSKQTSEELRLTSMGTSDFQWLFGYFYADFTAYQDAFIDAPGAVPLYGIANFVTLINPTTIIQQSFFGELSYQITPQIKATAGVRRYYYNESSTAFFSGLVGPTGTNTGATTVTSEHDQGLNPKFDLSYQPNSNLLLYSTVAKGFRPGGGVNPIPTTGVVGTVCEENLRTVYKSPSFILPPASFAPDQVWSYEIGEKLNAFEHRFTINSAVYYENWTGVQQVVPLPCGYIYTANAGNAHIYGSEVELQAVLVRDLILSANAGYTHARLVSSDVFGVGINPGTPLQDIPERTFSTSLAYRHSISDQLALTAHVENNYVGSRLDATYSINQLPSYDLTNFRVGVEDGGWSAVLFATNVFNTRAALNNINQISTNLPTYNRVVVNQPLTIGIDVSYRYGRRSR